MNWLGTIVRFIVSAVVYMIVAYLVPGFHLANFWSALIAAVVVALLGWAVEAMFGSRISRFGRGIVGFVVSVVILYVAQWVVPGMRVTVLGAIIASLVIGIVDLFLPMESPGTTSNTKSRD